MDIFLETIKITFPALIVAGLTYLLIKSAYEKELKKQVLDLKHNSKQVITPIRLQAYERLAMLLERIKLDNLLLRQTSNNLSAVQYRNILLVAIRSEFEHNLSQQVYVSGALWKLIKRVKEENTKIINLAAGKTGIDASGADLATAIMEIYMKTNPIPSDTALDLLRNEIKELY